MAWKWTTVNSYCAAVTDFIPHYGSLACNKHPSIQPAWAVLSLSLPFFMHVLLIKRPHVALHKIPLSRVLFARRLTATVTCWNTKRLGFYRKLLAYCAKSLFATRVAPDCRGDIAATSSAASLPSPLTANKNSTHARILDISTYEADEKCQACVGEGRSK